MKQKCEFFQMYLCGIRFRETIPKISFNMSTICINYQLKMLRESLTRVTNDFLREWSRPCSQGMSRLQNPEHSDRGKMGPIPL